MSKKIPLTQGAFALVDDEDYESLIRHKWCLSRGYAVRGVWHSESCRNETISMARQIMSAAPGVEVDHKNLDKLDNRKQNLRLCTRAENLRNRGKQHVVAGRKVSSRYKGVSFFKSRGNWRARIKMNGRYVYLGYFANEVEAGRAYDRAAKKLHGEFANLNFPEGD